MELNVTSVHIEPDLKILSSPWTIERKQESNWASPHNIYAIRVEYFEQELVLYFDSLLEIIDHDFPFAAKEKYMVITPAHEIKDMLNKIIKYCDKQWNNKKKNIWNSHGII